VANYKAAVADIQQFAVSASESIDKNAGPPSNILP
jgi:hypothetical protein